MKVLITGGYGFIGLAVVERLLKEDNDITVIDDFSTGNLDNRHTKVRTFNMSIVDKNCETIFRDTNFDVVIHLANRKFSKDNIDEYNKSLQINNLGLSNILYLSEKYNVDKLIILSSYFVYGKQELSPIKEEQIPKPQEAEAYNELIKELYCDQYRKKGLDIVTLRVGEIYGPRIDKEGNIIERLLQIQDDELVLELDNIKIDYIYLGDVVEAIKIVAENYTPSILNISTGKGVGQYEIFEIFSSYSYKYQNISIKENNEDSYDYILDNTKAISTLEWSPKYGLEEGIKKTILWHENSKDESQKLVSIVKEKKKKFYRNRNDNYKDIENILVFIIFALIDYLLRYKLGIKIELFILYIVFINLIYGFRQGSLAVFLSIIANIWFKFEFEDMKTFNLINDPTILLSSTIYFIVGISVGNMIDKIKIEKKILTQDLENTVNDVEFIYDMYEKSVKIKNTLQSVIENYDDSFQKTLDIIINLENLNDDIILKESRDILIKILKIESIYIYTIDEDKRYIKLIDAPEKCNFDSQIIIDENEFLKTVIINQKIFINKFLEKSLPIISAPLFKDGKVIGIIFIDQIDFELLNHQFLNTLKILIYLISNRLSKTKEYINPIINI